MYFSKRTCAATILASSSSSFVAFVISLLASSSAAEAVAAAAASTPLAKLDDGEGNTREGSGNSGGDVPTLLIASSLLVDEQRHHRLLGPDHSDVLQSTADNDRRHQHNQNQDHNGNEDTTLFLAKADTGILSRLTTSSSPSFQMMVGDDGSRSIVIIPSFTATNNYNNDIHSRSPPEAICATKGYVDCYNGYERGTGMACVTACAGECCVGNNACGAFTGKVCKDGSCTGDYACLQAAIPWVVNSCTGGGFSMCRRAGCLAGTVTNMVNSCNGPSSYACFSLGGSFGKVGEVRDSCIGVDACSFMGYGYDARVGDVINSCQGDGSCTRMANKYYNLPSQEDLNNCCHGYHSCIDSSIVPPQDTCVGTSTGPTNAPTTLYPSTEVSCGLAEYVDCYNGVVRGTSTPCETACAGECCVGTKACGAFTGKVCKDGSCTGEYACFQAAIPWVVNSCTGGGFGMCRKAGYLAGTVTNMVNSCNGPSSYACYSMGSSNGKVGEVRDSCIGFEACSFMGYG